MTYTDTFVGRLKRPFNWSDPNAELAKDDIELLTSSLMDGEIFSAVSRRANFGASRHLDWGSTAVPASKADILELMAHWKPGWDLPDPGDKSHKPRLSRARSLATVQGLPDGQYVLVTEEY